MISQQFKKFIFVGGIAAGINFISRIIFNETMSYRWAVFLAYLVGMVSAYIMQRAFVFGLSDHHPAKEFMYFSLVNMVAVTQVWLISVGLAEYFFPYIGFETFAREIAHGIGISIPVITSFYGHKYISFKKSTE